MWALLNEDRSDVEQVIINPVPIRIGEVQHPAQIFSTWSHEELCEVGIYQLYVQTCDETYWEVLGTDFELDHDKYVVYEKPIKQPKPVHNTKAYLVCEVQERAYVILLQSDWAVLRAWETNGRKPVPSELLEYRDQVRECADRKVIEIDQLDTIEECESYDIEAGWPVYVERAPYSRIQVLEAEKKRIEEMIQKRRRIAAIIALEAKENGEFDDLAQSGKTGNVEEALNED